MFLIIWCIRPNRNSSKIIGVSMVTFVAILGGFDSILSGMHLYLFSDPSNLYHYWKSESIALIIGCLIGLLIASILDKKLV